MIIYGSKSSLGLGISQDGYGTSFSFHVKGNGENNDKSSINLSSADLMQFIKIFKETRQFSLVRSYLNTRVQPNRPEQKYMNIKPNDDGSYFCTYSHKAGSNGEMTLYSFSLKITEDWMRVLYMAMEKCLHITLENDLKRFIGKGGDDAKTSTYN
jgi:hypothetical protein